MFNRLAFGVLFSLQDNKLTLGAEKAMTMGIIPVKTMKQIFNTLLDISLVYAR